MSDHPIPIYSVKEDAGLFTLMRDAKALETPRNAPVAVPKQKLAEHILKECQAQGERLDLRKMPMTQMTLTVLDIAQNHRSEVVAGIMRHGASELLCQRVSEPPELVDLQTRVWQPFLDWAERVYGAKFVSGTGIGAIAQNAACMNKIQSFVESQDDYHLIGLSEAVGMSGSLVLGLALMQKFADAQNIFAAAELDQLWQGKKWGDDPVTTARHASIIQDLSDCALWFSFFD